MSATAFKHLMSLPCQQLQILCLGHIHYDADGNKIGSRGGKILASIQLPNILQMRLGIS